MIDLYTLLVVAGLLHFALLPVSLSVPKVLDWRRSLAGLEPLTREIVWVHGAFIVLTIVGFGIVTLIGAQEIAEGRGLGPAVAGLVGGFWAARLAVQLAYYDPRHWPKAWWVTMGRYALTALFAYWTAVYGIAAGRGLCGG